MNPDVHKKSDLYCPFCLLQLTEVISNGNLFCPTAIPDICEYEAPNGQNKDYPPLTKLQQLETAFNHVQRKIKTNTDEYAQLIELQAKTAAELRVTNGAPPKDTALSIDLKITYTEHAALLAENQVRNIVQTTFGPGGVYLTDTPDNQWAINRLKELRQN